jgi:hypothetical protein
VTATLDGNRELVRAREIHARGDVCNIAAARDDCGMTIDHPIPE